MGMYDIFGSSGDQLKIFNVPLYYFNQNQYNEYKENNKEYGFLGYMDGNLRSYKIGDPIPWRDLCYNHTKNFTVVDKDFDGSIMLFVFRDGIFTNHEELDNNLDAIDWRKYDEYTNETMISSYGVSLDINSWFELRDFCYTWKEYEEAIDESDQKTNMIRRILYEYLKTIKDDEINEWNKAIDQLYSIQNMIVSTAKIKMEQYIIKNTGIFCDLENYGGYIYCVKSYMDREDESKDFKDALMHEAQKYIIDNDLRLEDYFSWNATPEEDKEWIKTIDKKIREWKKKEGD